MDTLSVPLIAAFVDNPIRPSLATEVKITLKSSVGRLSIKDTSGIAHSVHQFTAKNAADFGIGAFYNLTIEQAIWILALACYMMNPRILFSNSQPNLLKHLLKQEKIPLNVVTIDKPDGKIIKVNLASKITFKGELSKVFKTKLSLDESQILNVADKLLRFKIFDTTNKNYLELNIVEAVKRYIGASKSIDRLSCYESLYISFEKAVNADMDRRGKNFDEYASTLTGLMEVEIKKLCTFNNRIKHVIRCKKDLEDLKTGEKQFGLLALTLKKLLIKQS